MTNVSRRHSKTIHAPRQDNYCQLCDQSFVYPKDLRRHNRQIHPHLEPDFASEKSFTGDKRPYKCSETGCKYVIEGFKRDDHRVRHLNKNHLKCHKCLRTFGAFSTVEYHMLSHDEGGKFKCDQEGCAFKETGFSSKKFLGMHKDVLHQS